MSSILKRVVIACPRHTTKWQVASAASERNKHAIAKMRTEEGGILNNMVMTTRQTLTLHAHTSLALSLFRRRTHKIGYTIKPGNNNAPPSVNTIKFVISY